MFLYVVNMSVAASVIGGVLVVLRAIFKKRLPRWVFYLAWAAVLVRMLLPFSVESPFSLFNFIPTSPASSVQETGGVGRIVTFVEPRERYVEYPILQKSSPVFAGMAGEEARAVIAQAPIPLTTILTVVWLCGTVFLLLYSLLCFAHTLWRLKDAEPLPLEDIGVALTGSGRKRVRACRSSLFTGPVVCGLFRPILVFPYGMRSEELYHVLAHELTHVRRGDNFWKAISTLALYIHWFNPLVWLFYSLYVTDMEASCDEAVVRRGYVEPKAYATCLLQMAVKGGNAFTGGFLAFGECALKERIKSILRVRKSTVLFTILCFAVLTGLGIVFLTNPQQRMEQSIQQVAGTPGISTGNVPEQALEMLDTAEVFRITVEQMGGGAEADSLWNVPENCFSAMISCLQTLPLSRPMERAPLVMGTQGHRDLSVYVDFKNGNGLRVRLLDTYLEVQGDLGSMTSRVIHNYSLTEGESLELLERIQATRKAIGASISSEASSSTEGFSVDQQEEGMTDNSSAAEMMPTESEPGKLPKKSVVSDASENMAQIQKDFILEDNPDCLRLDFLEVASATLIHKGDHLVTGLKEEEVRAAVELLNAIPVGEGLHLEPAPGAILMLRLFMADGRAYEYWLHDNVLMLGNDTQLAAGEDILPLNKWAHDLMEEKRNQGVLGVEWFKEMDETSVTTLRIYNGTAGVKTSTGEEGGGIGGYTVGNSQRDDSLIYRIIDCLRRLPVTAQSPAERTGDPAIRTREKYELERTLFLQFDSGRHRCGVYFFRDGSMHVEVTWEQYFAAYTIPDTPVRETLLEMIRTSAVD